MTPRECVPGGHTGAMELSVQPPLIVVGVDVQGPFDQLHRLVPEGWSRWWALEDQVEQRVSAVSTEVSFSAGDGTYREVLGARVTQTPVLLPEGLVAVELSESRCVTSRHDGPEEGIAERFGEMQDFARSHDLEPAGVLVDEGYTRAGGGSHQLYVRVR